MRCAGGASINYRSAALASTLVLSGSALLVDAKRAGHAPLRHEEDSMTSSAKLDQEPHEDGSLEVSNSHTERHAKRGTPVLLGPPRVEDDVIPQVELVLSFHALLKALKAAKVALGVVGWYPPNGAIRLTTPVADFKKVVFLVVGRSALKDIAHNLDVLGCDDGHGPPLVRFGICQEHAFTLGNEALLTPIVRYAVVLNVD